MKMILGNDFIFESETILPNERQRSRKQKISTHSLFGQRDAKQHLGPGEDEFTMPGSIFPGKLGTADSLDALAALADLGLSHRLIDDQGSIHGKWMISSIDETYTHYNNQSVARQIDFSIKLSRTS